MPLLLVVLRRIDAIFASTYAASSACRRDCAKMICGGSLSSRGSTRPARRPDLSFPGIVPVAMRSSVFTPLDNRRVLPKKASVRPTTPTGRSNTARLLRLSQSDHSQRDTPPPRAARRAHREHYLQHSSTRHRRTAPPSKESHHGPARLPARGAHQHEDHVETDGERLQKMREERKKIQKRRQEGRISASHVGAFTSIRLVSGNDGRGWSLF